MVCSYFFQKSDPLSFTARLEKNEFKIVWIFFLHCSLNLWLMCTQTSYADFNLPQLPCALRSCSKNYIPWKHDKTIQLWSICTVFEISNSPGLPNFISGNQANTFLEEIHVYGTLTATKQKLNYMILIYHHLYFQLWKTLFIKLSKY